MNPATIRKMRRTCLTVRRSIRVRGTFWRRGWDSDQGLYPAKRNTRSVMYYSMATMTGQSASIETLMYLASR